MRYVHLLLLQHHELIHLAKRSNVSFVDNLSSMQFDMTLKPAGNQVPSAQSQEPCHCRHEGKRHQKSQRGIHLTLTPHSLSDLRCDKVCLSLLLQHLAACAPLCFTGRSFHWFITQHPVLSRRYCTEVTSVIILVEHFNNFFHSMEWFC